MTEQGTIKWFNEAKGLGFITRGHDADILFLLGNVKAHFNIGDKVSFELIIGAKGLEAKNVVKIG